MGRVMSLKATPTLSEGFTNAFSGNPECMALAETNAEFIYMSVVPSTSGVTFANGTDTSDATTTINWMCVGPR